MADIGDTGSLWSGGFWLIAALLLIGVGLLLLLSLIGARRTSLAPALSADRLLYRDQLATIERDLARGAIDSAEAARLKTEVARRLLEADRRNPEAISGGQKGLAAMLLPVLAILGVLGGTLALYHRLGAPGLPDQPLAERIAEADQRIATRRDQASFVASLPPAPARNSDPEFESLMQALRQGVDATSSQDQTGLALLARNEAVLGNFVAARTAQERLIAVKGTEAEADDHVMLAEILISQAGGYVSPEAEAALKAALALDPRSGLARYYTGLIQAQGGRFDRAFAIWQPLLAEGPQSASYMPTLRAQIGDVAAYAGVSYTPPPAPVEDDETRAMAETMVAQLGARLASEGGSSGEWARLIYSLSVLGRSDEAKEILAEARQIFPGGEDRAVVDEAARAAGLQEVQP